MIKAQRIEKLDPELLGGPGVYHCWLKIVTDPLGSPISVPVIIAKGKKAGKTIGITAAVHGDEINGIPVIHRLFNSLNVDKLTGNIIAVPIVNIPSFINQERRFVDSVDLNHVMPGEKNGSVSSVYAHRFFHQVIPQFDYLIDLHTASAGRINSYYIRADLSDQITSEIARLHNAQIIVHNPPSDGTLRGSASELGIPSITLEIGNPNIFQKGIIKDSLDGIYNVLNFLDFYKEKEIYIDEKPIICTHSYWIYTTNGGILRVKPQLVQKVSRKEKIATMHNIFGVQTEEYLSPEDGIIIGKSTSPVNQTGGRVLHLGIMAEDSFDPSSGK